MTGRGLSTGPMAMISTGPSRSVRRARMMSPVAGSTPVFVPRLGVRKPGQSALAVTIAATAGPGTWNAYDDQVSAAGRLGPPGGMGGCCERDLAGGGSRSMRSAPSSRRIASSSLTIASVNRTRATTLRLSSS